MNHTTPRPNRLNPRLTTLAAALCLAFGSASAQTEAPSAAPSADDVRRDIYQLDSRVSLGVGGMASNARRFGQYRGLGEKGTYGILDLDYIQRDEETGTWVKLIGRRLGIDGERDIKVVHERQGDWSYSLQGTQLVRNEPLIVNTGLTGVGTGLQVVSATAPKRDLDLKIEHDVVAFGARKFLLGGFDVQFSFKEDTATGDRMFGRGTPSVMEFLTEPIDRTTRQWQADARYAGRDLQLALTYAGSSYDNRIPVLNSSGGNSAAGAFGSAWVMALPPSNSAHQLQVSGGYRLDKTTRTSFRLARTVALQDEPFDPVFTRLTDAPTSLHGRVVTTLGYADISARPVPDLDLTAIFRREDRDDQTPEARFLAPQLPTVGGSFSSAGVSGLVKPRSLTVINSTVEGGYRLGGGNRVMAGLDNEIIKRNAPQLYRRVGFRENTDESTARVQYRRSMSDTVNGSLGYLHSTRTGSDYLPDTFDPNARTNQVVALLWSDRQRDKFRGTLDWTPLEALSLQVQVDHSSDEYTGRALGPRRGDARLFAVDGLWRPADNWSVTLWASREVTEARQDARSDLVASAATGGNTLWSPTIEYRTASLGLGVKGKPLAVLEVGAEVSGSRDLVSHELVQTGGTGTLPVSSLPPFRYDTTSIKLFADYALTRMSGIKTQLLAERRRNDDWTWTNWVYNGAPSTPVASRTSDGTTVTNQPQETAGMVAIVYHLRWR